jgi:hypothetical protein
MSAGLPVQRFRTKVDWWVVLVYGVLAVNLVGRPAIAWWNEGQFAPQIVVGIGVLGTLLYLAATTAYTVSDDSLVVRWGPFRSTTTLHTIYKIRPTRTLLSAPALSLDRIEVLARSGPSAIVSPADKEGFVQAIQARVGEIELDDIETPIPPSSHSLTS